MPITFRRKGTLPEVNSWNALYNRASGSALWSDNTFAGLDNPVLQANYIAMLAGNTKALQDRLPEDFSYASANTQYSVLAALNSFTQEELQMSDEEYAQAQQNKLNQAFNEQITSDENFQQYGGINEFVQNNYSGDYSKFYQDYGNNYEGFMSPENLENISYDNYEGITPESTKEAFDYLSSAYKQLETRYSKERDITWTKLLNQIELEKTEYLKRKAWDEASVWEKIGHTAASFLAMPITEGGEIIEGLIDGGATVAMWITNAFGNEGAANDIRNFIGEDIIPLDTMLKEALPNSWATSDYTSWYNPAKLIYNVGTSIADMAPMALNLAVPGLGTAIYYASSAGRTAEATIQEHPDWSINEITLYTAGATAIEYATEHISGDSIFGPGWFSKYTNVGATKVGAAVNKALQRPAIKMVKEALGEGLEEVLSELGSSILEGIMTGDFDSAFEDFGTNAIQSFVIGAAMGGVISVSSSAKVNRLVNKVHKQITTADGNIVTLSMSQSVIIDNFLTEMDERLSKGVKLSEKNQARYDALKSLQIRDMDEAAAKSLLAAARRKSYLNMRGNITYTIRQQTDVSVETGAIGNASQTANSIQYSRYGYNETISNPVGETEPVYTYTTSTGRITDYSTLESVFSNTETVDYDYDQPAVDTLGIEDYWYDVPEDMSQKLSTEVSLLLALQTNSMIKQFGQEAFTNGLHLFEQQTMKTVDDIVKLNDFRKQRMNKAASGLKQSVIDAFGGDLDIIFTEKSANELKTPNGDIRNLIFGISAHKNIKQVQTFVTTKTDMPTMFVYEYNGTPILFANQSLLNVRSFGTLVRMSAACQATYYWVQEIMANPEANALIESFLDRLDIKKVPRLIQYQQLLYTAAFVENNPIANAMAWRDYEAYGKIKQILENLVNPKKNHTYNVLQFIREEVQNVAGSGLKVYDGTILSNISEDDIEQYRKDLSTNVTQQFIDNRLGEEDFIPSARTTPYLYFGGNVSKQSVMLIAAIRQFGKDFGFAADSIKNCTLDQAVVKIFDRQNYSKDGLKVLDNALRRYDYADVSNFRGKLNYYLQDYFGFSVLPDNTVIKNEFVTEVLNIDRLNELLTDEVVEFNLSDVLTDYGRERLGINFSDITIKYRDRVPKDLKEHPGAWAWCTLNRTSNGTNYGGEIVILRGTQEKVSQYEGPGTGTFDRNGDVVFMNPYTQLAVHEIQHYITAMTIGVESAAALLNSLNLETLLPQLVNTPEKIEACYDFCIFSGVLKRSDYPTVGMFAKDSKQFQKHFHETDSNNRTFLDRLSSAVYTYLDINEAMSRGQNNMFQRTNAISSYDSGVNIINDFKSFRIVQTNSKDPFIKSFNNLVVSYINTKIKDYIQLLQSAKLMNDDVIAEIFSAGDNWVPSLPSDTAAGSFVSLEELAKVFSKENIPEDLSVLTTKDYWVDKATNPELRTYIRSLPELQFKRYLQRFTGVSLDVLSKDFKPKFDTSELELARDTNYSSIIAEDASGNLRVISTANPNAAFSSYNAKGVITWNAKTRTAIFNFNTHKLSKEVLAVMDKLNRWTKDGGKQRFIVNDRVFNNAIAASNYLNTQAKPAVAEDSNLAANFDALFTKITETAVKGPVAVYNLDTIFITNDGKIYNIDSNGNLLQTLKDMCEVSYLETIGEVSVDPVTGEAIPDENGLNKAIDKLFRDKKVVRLSKTEKGWVAYGIPNILQDNFIKLMRAEARNHSYILEGDIGYNIRKSGLIVEDGKVKVKYADAEGNIAGQEVPWKTSKWYSAICNIISKYQLTSVSQLKRLGFSDDFIEHITNYTGRRMSEKTRRFYNVNKAEEVYNGIDHSYIIQYINDDTNTELSRNILIANCPDSTAESGNLDWKQNAHIHTVQEAKDYLQAVSAYWAAMTVAADNNVYNSISELQAAYAGKVNSDDPRYVKLSATMADASQNTGKITAVLNDDARKTGNIVTPRDESGNIIGESYQNKIYHNGLDVSLLAFSNVKYRMEQGEYTLEVQTVEDTQTGRHKDEEDAVSLSDRQSALTDYGNVETQLINRENREALEKVTSEITKINKDTNLQSRLNKLQNVLDDLPQYDLDEGAEKRLRKQLETAIAGISNRTISKLDEAGIQAEVNRITEKLKADSELTGQARVTAQADNDAAYAKFRGEKIRNVARFGEEGYKQILRVYSENNATAMNNITSKFSKFFKQLNANRPDNSPSPTQQYFQQLMATQVENGNKLNLANEFYDLIRETLRTRNNTKLSNFLQNKLQPYIYNAIKAGDYNFKSPIDRQILEVIDGIIGDNSTSNSEKANTLLNIIEAYTQEDSDERISKEAQLRIEALIDQLAPADNISISDTEAKSYINLDRLKSVLSKTLDTSTVDNVSKTVKQVDMQRKKKDSALDTSVAEKWKAIKQANFEINYVTGTYDRMLKEYRKMAQSKPVTTEDMQNALKEVYESIMSEGVNNPKRTGIFDATKNVYQSMARSEWNDMNEDKAKFLRMKGESKFEVANEEFKKEYPELVKIINEYNLHPESRPKQGSPEFEKYREPLLKQREFLNRYVHDKTAEYREERRRYIESRTIALRRQYNEQRASIRKTAIELWNNIQTRNNTGWYEAARKYDIQGPQGFAQTNNISARRQELISEIAGAQAAGDTKRYERLNRELMTVNAQYERIAQTLDQSPITTIIEDRNKFVQDYMRKNLTAPEEFTRVQRDFNQYVETNTFNKQYSSTLAKRLNGLEVIYSEFIFAPKTQAAIDKLKSDVQTVLKEGRLNEYVRGDTNRQLVQISDRPAHLVEQVLQKFKEGRYIDRSNVMDEIITTQSKQYEEILKNAAEQITKYFDAGNPDNIVTANTDEVSPDMFAPSDNMAMPNIFDSTENAVIEIDDYAAKSYIDLNKLKNVLGKTLNQDQVSNTVKTVRQLDAARNKKDTKLDTSVAEKWRAVQRASFDINYIGNTYDRLVREYQRLSNSPAVTDEQMQNALKDIYRMITEDTKTDRSDAERNKIFDITRDVDRENARKEWIAKHPEEVKFLGDSNLRKRLAHEAFTKKYPSKADIIKNAPAYMNLPERQKIFNEVKKDYESFVKKYIREKVSDYRQNRSDYVRYSIEAARRDRRGEGNYRTDQRGWKEYLNDNIHFKQMSTTLIKRINGLKIAFAEFCLAPKTEASIAKLNNDVRTILIDGRLNDYIRGSTNRELLQISDKLSRADQAKDAGTIVDETISLFKNGKYVDRSHVISDALNTAESQYKATLETAAAAITKYLETDHPDNTVTANFEDSNEVSPDMFAPSDPAAMSEDEFFSGLADSLGELDTVPKGKKRGRPAKTTEPVIPIETDVFDEIDAELAAIDDGFDEFDDFDEFTGEEPATVEEATETEESSTAGPAQAEEVPAQTRKPKRTENEIFEELNTEDARMHKTINSRNLYAYGVDIRPVFRYVFEKKESRSLLGKPFDRQIFNTEEFRKNPTIASIISELTTNERAARAFVEWAANRPSINSEYQSRMLILLNIIRTSPELSVDIRTAAREIFEVERSASARNLGLFKHSGLTPVEELCEIALSNFALAPDEKLEMQRLINMQAKAIEDDNYAEADKATEDMLKIFEKHKDELDNSINFFNAKTPEERANRLRNFANRINAFRYFAMLSMPATFFTRNVAANAILTAMDKTAAGISTLAMKGIEQLSGGENQYKRTTNRVSEEAKQVTDNLLVKNGLIDSILNNTVSKYDTGYDYNSTALEKIAADDLIDDPMNQKVIELNNKLNEKTPFGDGNFGRFLNNIYNKIFGVMDKYDKIFMRRRIIEMTQKLVSDNFTTEQLQELNNGNEVLKHRFDDMVEYSRLEATKIYLRSMPKLYKTVMSALDKYPVAKVITSIIIPFPRMLINTTMTALAYSPFGLIKAGLTLARDKSAFRNITAAKQLGRAVVGTTGIVLGAILASLGLLAIDDDDEYAGPQLVLFGKFSMSLENLSPASLPLIVGASMASDSTAGVWDTLLIGGNALFDATFIGELINSFGGNKEPVDIISNTFASFVTQFIPSFIRRAAQVIDPYQKDTSGNWKFVKRIIQAIPGASLLLDNKVDPYTGEDMTRYTNNNNPWLSRFLAIFNAIYPMQTKYIGESEVETESEAVDAATTGPSSTYTIDGVTYKLSSKQYKDYQKLRAQLYSQYANELINTDRYKKMSMENKRKALKSLQNRATTEARRQLKIGQFAR